MAAVHFGRTKNIANRSKKYLEEALHKRLFREGSSDKAIRTELNQFLDSNKRVYKWEVGMSVKKLRQRKRFAPALKLVESMAKRGMNMTVSDQAIHLDIIAKTRGIPAAESFFVGLPEASKNHLCYGALLNCYCKELMTEKAEALMEKMKELRFDSTSMAYNSLMTLYTKAGQPEKVPAIIQEMKASNVMPDSYTYNVWMRALAAVSDISGVERVIEEMRRDGRVAGDWTTYSNLASIYVGAGMFEKAERALKELENRNACRDLSAYQYLITLYGRTGNLLEVHRACLVLRNVSVNGNRNGSTYDIRIANALIGAYAKEGLLEKAETLKERARRSGAKPNVKTWEIFMDYHLKKSNTSLAVDCVTNGISIGRGDGRKWVPPQNVVQTLMSHFEQARDVEGAESFLETLKKVEDVFGADVFESLIRTYAAAGKTSPSLRRRLKMENVDVSEATKKLLEVDVPLPQLSEWRGLLDSQQQPINPSATFSERTKKWKEELDQELERKRDKLREAISYVKLGLFMYRFQLTGYDRYIIGLCKVDAPGWCWRKDLVSKGSSSNLAKITVCIPRKVNALILLSSCAYEGLFLD
ncbi:hypothetical protein IFM89_023791 [Coptis chinensis]|uniref:Pentatricopeptide repeat-containing protein n=1 Tax=Coptis chinensis TaxID=261450 RepID=A0A835HPB0_9MAGN|nr:hypothetical protein IFM89_023791 [Coptis chinensis]